MTRGNYPRRYIVAPRIRKLVPCGYCFEEWASGYDHILPVFRGGTNKKSNLYPACRRCNSLASAIEFKSLDEKRDYIRAKLKERNEWHTADQMLKLRESLPAEEKTPDLLFRTVPMERVERKKPAPKTNAECAICRGKYWKPALGSPLCSKTCYEILWFNKLMDRYLEAVHFKLEFRSK